MPKPKRRANTEWIGGLVELPNWITGEGPAYRPEALIWLNHDGLVLGTVLGRPGEVLGQAAEHLLATAAQPMFGTPHRPTRVRVASERLAAALEDADLDCAIVRDATPEIDHVVDALVAHLDEADGEPPTYLVGDVTPAAVAALFEAAAALHRVQPWAIVPADDDIIGVSSAALGWQDAVLTIIGQMGENFGFVLFENRRDFDAFVNIAMDPDGEAPPRVPPHLSLNFERGADVDPALRREIATHGWEVAGADAYPWLSLIEPDLVQRPASGAELARAEAITRALLQLCAEPERVRAAFAGGEPLEHELEVPTHAGPVTITLRLPWRRDLAHLAPPYDVLAGLRALEEDDALDAEHRADLNAELLRRFAAAPEAAGIDDPWIVSLALNLAAHHFAATAATLDAELLGELLYDIMPSKVMVGADDAEEIVAQLRAFYTWLGREHGLAEAAECLAYLDGEGLIEDLAEALEDRASFGIGKTMLAAGREAGFDIDTEDGLRAWLETMKDNPWTLPDVPGTASRGNADARKRKRKQARKARKRNRKH